MSENQVKDITSAQNAAARFLQSQTAGKKTRGLTFTRTWVQASPTREIWEVEGHFEVPQGIMSWTRKNFKVQVEPSEGRVVGYDGI